MKYGGQFPNDILSNNAQFDDYDQWIDIVVFIFMGYGRSIGVH